MNSLSKCLKFIFLIGWIPFIVSCQKKKLQFKLDKPNIIIFLADDLGYGDLGCYGHPVIKTPNLDRLAQDGVKLNRFYAASPVCSPSRVGLMTGKIPNRLGVYDWIPENSNMHIPDSVTTLPRLLKENGYQTGLFGKWHCNGKFNRPEQPQPDDLGFDYWIATQNNAVPSHENPENFVKNGQPVGKMSGFSSQLMADEVITWLDNKRDSQPFFCYVPFHEPHEPVASPPDLVDSYLDQAINVDQAQYFANVSNMDRAIGRVINKLKESGELENTLIIFTSDNGPETLGRYPGTNRSYGSPGNLRGMKVQLYEGGVRVPCIIYWPGLNSRSETTDKVISSLDILPTVADLIDVDLPKNEIFDGENIIPVLKGEKPQREKELFWFYPTAVVGPNIAMVSGENKLMAKSTYEYIEPGKTGGILINNESVHAIVNDSVSANYFLFNLNINPSEQQSLSAYSSHLVDSLNARLRDRFYDLRENSPEINLRQ